MASNRPDPHTGKMMSKGGHIIHDVPSMPQEHGGSMPQDTAVGSGSRPTRSKVEIMTSAPTNPHTQDRDPPPFLGGSGGGRKLDQ